MKRNFIQESKKETGKFGHHGFMMLCRSIWCGRQLHVRKGCCWLCQSNLVRFEESSLHLQIWVCKQQSCGTFSLASGTGTCEYPQPTGLATVASFSQGKSLFYLLQLSPKFGFPPTTIKPGISPPSTFQTVHFTSLERFWRLFATVTVVLSFSFLKKFQLNLWKIIVNHKKIIK